MNILSMFQEKLLAWYDSCGRDLPWRRVRDPYYVLVTELMLQQTQVSRVLLRLPQFLYLFPSFSAIASASTTDLIKSWTGMGYNNRILRFQKLSKIVVADYDGTLPRSIGELQKLPGIGKYTAHAVACFAFGQNVAIVDVNIRRVYSRIFWRLEYFHEMKDERKVWDLADAMLPPRVYDFNQALMDFGAIVCTARNPKCVKCPVASLCKSAGVLVQADVQRRTEPSRQGVPNRIFRGRIVEWLRKNERGDAMEIATIIVPQFLLSDKDWFMSLVNALENDGLVVMEGEIMRLK